MARSSKLMDSLKIQARTIKKQTCEITTGHRYDRISSYINPNDDTEYFVYMCSQCKHVKTIKAHGVL